MDLDQEAHRLYLADRTMGGVDVFDVSGPVGKYMLTVKTASPPNGVSVGANVHKVYAGLNDSSVAIIDVDPSSRTFNTVIANPNTGGRMRADEMDYDPAHRKLYAANSDDNFVSVIDGVSNQIIKRIDGLADGLEQPRYNPADRMVYLPSTRANVLYKFDPVNDELVQTFDIVDPCNPNGLAINPNTNLGLLGCSSRQGYQHAALWDFATDRVVATFDQIGGGNATLYDPVADRFFFTAASEGQPLMGIFRGAPVQFLGNVAAGGGGSRSRSTRRIGSYTCKIGGRTCQGS